MSEAHAPSLPDGIEQAFQVAAGELGLASASWLFLREVSQEGGDPLVTALRDRLGRAFPVLDAVAARWLEGSRAPDIDPTHVLDALEGTRRLVLVGIEAAFLDALVPRLPEDTEIALLCRNPFEVNWERVISNFAPRLSLLDLDHFQRFAGPRSALLTFIYGIHGRNVHALPGWMRVIGDDVSTQFRSIVAWDVLCAPMFVFPRWLSEAPLESFTHVISP